MRQYELVERVTSYDPNADESLLNRAYVYAMQAHGHQVRASGDPFFSHPLEVAAILTDLHLDDATIATALLHDTIEDTEATREDIDRLFGPEIGKLVDGLTKIKKLDLVTKEARQAENFRKLILAISSDVRVLLVKLADRLHNMRTLDHMKPEKRLLVAEETMDIYAPLAGRMGIHWLQEELEDLSFRWINVSAYDTVCKRLVDLRDSNQGLIDGIKTELVDQLEEADIEATVSGREKRPFSIWRKMEHRQLSLEQLSDIYGFRVIVDRLEDCYRVLGVAHSTWRAVPGRFKDYISNPKQNDYQSLHTTIVGPSRQRVELQIRTKAMHEVAEYGIAAHVLYKEKGGNGQSPDKHSDLRIESNAYRWLRHLVEVLKEGDNPEEFLEHTKLELFRDQVFCFTPKGRLIALPKGATAIDFAYAVHTDIGNRCIGAKVNGRHYPLVTELQNGDEVEIICSDAQTPPIAWERIAITGKARSAIRRAARDAIKEQYCSLGRDILKSAFARVDKSYTDESLTQALHRLSQSTTEEVLAAVGRGELASEDVVRALYPDIPESRPAGRAALKRDDKGWFGLAKAIGLKFMWPGGRERKTAGGATAGNGEEAVPIRGTESNVPVRFCPQGGAVPGDRIVGILTPGEGITIYPIQSKALAEFDDQPERWVDVTWDIDPAGRTRFPSQIAVTVVNEPGSLAQIAQVIGERDGNIDNIKMMRRAADYTDMLIDLEVRDVKHLNDILGIVRGRSVVSKADRVIG